MMNRTNQALLGTLMLAMLGSCGTPKRWVENRELLADGLVAFEAGDYHQVETTMNALLSATNTKEYRDTYALQRYFATSMTLRAHMEAAFKNSFLREHSGGGQSSFDISSVQHAEGTPSEVGHLVAANFQVAYLRSWFEGSVERPTRIGEGEAAIPLLPAKLEDFGMKDSHANGVLSLVAIHSRLQFQDRVNTIVGDISALNTLNGCNAMMDNSMLSENVKAWVYRGIFGYMKTFPDRSHEAFKFAVSALESHRKAPGSMTSGELQPIRSWITDNPIIKFVCPTDGTEAIPDLDNCLLCSASYLTFIPTAKDPSAPEGN